MQLGWPVVELAVAAAGPAVVVVEIVEASWLVELAVLQLGVVLVAAGLAVALLGLAVFEFVPAGLAAAAPAAVGLAPVLVVSKQDNR